MLYNGERGQERGSQLTNTLHSPIRHNWSWVVEQDVYAIWTRNTPH